MTVGETEAHIFEKANRQALIYFGIATALTGLTAFFIAAVIQRQSTLEGLNARLSTLNRHFDAALRAPRKIDFVANRGLSWSERLRIGTRTNRNHSTTILWRAIGSGYFSRCPSAICRRASRCMTAIIGW
jgi:hypothetical protein